MQKIVGFDASSWVPQANTEGILVEELLPHLEGLAPCNKFFVLKLQRSEYTWHGDFNEAYIIVGNIND